MVKKMEQAKSMIKMVEYNLKENILMVKNGMEKDIII